MTLLWQGKLVQPRAGAARFTVRGDVTALMVDGFLALPVGKGVRTADVWLESGTHDMTVFASAGPATQTVDAGWFRGDSNVQEVVFSPFKERDFDLKQPAAKAPKTRKPAQVTVKDTDWEFQFEPAEVRYVRLVVQEYRGEAVAINHVEISDSVAGKVHIPTETDLLSLATNDILEIAGGDVVTASYVDEFNTTGIVAVADRPVEGDLPQCQHHAHRLRLCPVGQRAGLRAAQAGAARRSRRSLHRRGD